MLMALSYLFDGGDVGGEEVLQCALVEWLSQNCSFLPLIQLYPLSLLYILLFY
jgi:hypothetical protein